MKIIYAALGVLTALPSVAQEYPDFDGVYRYADAPEELCESEFDRVVIENGTFFGLENQCDLTSPTPIPDLKAVLYTAKCSGEGTEYETAIMLKASDDGSVFGIYADWVVEWVPCP